MVGTDTADTVIVTFAVLLAVVWKTAFFDICTVTGNEPTDAYVWVPVIEKFPAEPLTMPDVVVLSPQFMVTL